MSSKPPGITRLKIKSNRPWMSGQTSCMRSKAKRPTDWPLPCGERMRSPWDVHRSLRRSLTLPSWIQRRPMRKCQLSPRLKPVRPAARIWHCLQTVLTKRRKLGRTRRGRARHAEAHGDCCDRERLALAQRQMEYPVPISARKFQAPMDDTSANGCCSNRDCGRARALEQAAEPRRACDSDRLRPRRRTPFGRHTGTHRRDSSGHVASQLQVTGGLVNQERRDRRA